MEFSDFLKQGERARLIPVLADTNREQRITSIFLSLLPQIPELAKELFASINVSVGKRARIDTFTEVVLNDCGGIGNRPDGLIVVSTGKSMWTALVECKIGNADLDPDQVSRYLELAKLNKINAVITLSNEFVSRADHSPVTVSKNLLRKTDLFHWSWTWIRTQCEIVQHQNLIADPDQGFLLSEFIRFLRHDKTGVERFTQMGKEWRDLVQSVATQQKLKKTDVGVEDGVACWYAEERDLCLQLARSVRKEVNIKIDRKLAADPVERLKVGVTKLVDENALRSVFQVPDCASDIEVCADVSKKAIIVSMKLKAPQDKKSTKARLNWLLRMIKEDDERLYVRAHWPGRAQETQRELSVLRTDPMAIQTDNPELVPHAFEVLLVEDLGKRFPGRRTFIEDLERVVPDFYELVGQHLRAWQAPPPRPVKSSDDMDDDAQVKNDVPDGSPEN